MPRRHVYPGTYLGESRPLRIVSANVNSSGPAHMTLLQLAYENDADVVLVQEPSTHWEDTRRLTKTHPGFSTLPPTHDWSEKPRVMTYARKDRLELQISADPAFPAHSDVMAIEVSGLRPGPL